MGKPERLERFVFATDNHGDAADPDTLHALRSFVGQFKPEVRIHGGDCFDFRWLRRSASDEEKLATVTADFEAGLDLLAWFKPTVFLWGNHDQRLVDALDSTSGATRHLAAQWIDRIEVATRGAAHYRYNKRTGIHRYADHAFLHGYAHGVGATRKHALVYGSCVFGHIHTHDQVTIERHDRATAHAVGCLCQLDFDYNRSNVGTLRQELGWAYGYRCPSGELVVLHARRIGGRWICPTV